MRVISFAGLRCEVFQLDGDSNIAVTIGVAAKLSISAGFNFPQPHVTAIEIHPRMSAIATREKYIIGISRLCGCGRNLTVREGASCYCTLPYGRVSERGFVKIEIPAAGHQTCGWIVLDGSNLRS